MGQIFVGRHAIVTASAVSLLTGLTFLLGTCRQPPESGQDSPNWNDAVASLIASDAEAYTRARPTQSISEFSSDEVLRWIRTHRIISGPGQTPGFAEHARQVCQSAKISWNLRQESSYGNLAKGHQVIRIDVYLADGTHDIAEIEIMPDGSHVPP